MTEQVVGKRLGWLLAGGVCCWLTGCGGELYKRNVNETALYYAHRQQLDVNLKPVWPTTPNAPISLRVPKQFELIPPPKPKPDPDDPNKMIPVPSEEDPRQPHYIHAILPGLEAAWQTTMEVAVGQGSAKVPAYMYLLSNRERYLDPDLAKRALEFHVDVMTELTTKLDVPYPAPEDPAWESPRYPAGEGYVEQKSYTSITLKPEKPINGAPAHVTVYLYQNQDIQVAVVFVIPQEPDSRQRVRERIALCLETLKVSGERPGRYGGQAKAKRPDF